MALVHHGYDGRGQLCPRCQVVFGSDAYKEKWEKGGFIKIHESLDDFENARRYDCYICSYVLSHISPTKIRAMFSSSSAVLAPFSLHVILFGSFCLLRCPDGMRHRFVRLHSCPGNNTTDAYISKWERILSPPMFGIDTSTSKAFHIYKEWLSTCLHRHENCGSRSPGAVYPKRLIDVGDTELNPRVRLVETSDVSRKPYFTLSHCWGGKIDYRLQSNTLDEMMSSLTKDKMSKTFQDAVDVTRRLGYRYLWVDALCIIQDSDPDWEAEAPRMADIYGNATCCLAATWASGGQGLYKESPQRQPPIVDRSVLFGFKDSKGSKVALSKWPDFDETLEDSPLNKRAWVLQERLLSPRVLHFADGYVLWTCRKTFEADTGDCSDESAYGNTRIYDRRTSVPPTLSCSMSDHQLMSNWFLICAAYSGTILTRETDRMIALSGLAERFGERVGSNYFGGIWTKWLVPSLCWETAPRRRDGDRPSTDFPSFCWPSVQHGISYQESRLLALNREQTLVEVRCTDVPSSTATYAERGTGRQLVLKGSAVPQERFTGKLVWSAEDARSNKCMFGHTRPETGLQRQCLITMDFDLTDAMFSETSSFLFLPLIQTKIMRKRRKIIGLVVISAKHANSTNTADESSADLQPSSTTASVSDMTPGLLAISISKTQSIESIHTLLAEYPASEIVLI